MQMARRRTDRHNRKIANTRARSVSADWINPGRRRVEIYRTRLIGAKQQEKIFAMYSGSSNR